MNYRKLGNTGMSVSEVGMGCWGIGSKAYGTVSDSVCIATLMTAYQEGVNFFDTADIYGDGHSEEVVGKALRNVRSRVKIATKVGSLPHQGREMPVALDEAHIRKSVDESLRRLQTSYIDLYQLHSPPLLLMEDAIGVLADLKGEGKIRAVGVSAKSPEDAMEAIIDHRVDVVQVNYNMIDQRARELGVMDLARDLEVGLIVRTPLAFGFLTGRYPVGSKFEAPDHRANWSQAQIDLWADAWRLFGDGGTAKALGFCLAHEGVSTVIPGMLKPSDVEENTHYQLLTLEEVKIIEQVYNENNFFIGNKE